MDPYEKEVARLRALYESVLTDEENSVADSNVLSDEEDNDSDGSIQDRDAQIFSDHQSESEQDGFDDCSDDEKFDESDRRLFYYGKDGTKWKKLAPPKNIRTRRENIVSHLPGTIKEGKEVMTPLDSWNLLFNDIIDLVVKYTNIYITEISERYKDKRDAKSTTVSEMKAFIGLLYLAGLDHGAKKNLKDFWCQDGLGSELFIATMAQRRFRFLLRVIRFDDKRNRANRSEIDKLAPVREMFEKLNDNFKKYYTVGEYVTLDEMLFAFRGRCSFRMYIPNKPKKFGIKVFATVDSRTFYTNHMEIYAGVQPDGPYKLNNSTEAVTLRMCQHFSGTGRNITMDRWFTGINVVGKLLTEHRLTVVGTIKTNKREIPTILTNVKKRPINSSVFAFGEKMMIVSYVPRKAKNVLLLSSLHHTDTVDDESSKPEINLFYNAMKCGVDIVDKMASTYNVARNTKRWPLVIFYGMLNIASINAFVILRHNHPTSDVSKERRLFIKHLGKELVKDHISSRANSPGLHTYIRDTAAKYSGTTRQDVPDPPPNKRGHCKYCKKRKTRYFCKFCKCWLCMEHILACCRECVDPQANN